MGDVKMMAMVGAFLGVRGAFLTILLGTLLGTLVGVSIIVFLYVAGWQRKLAERASRRRLGSVNAIVPRFSGRAYITGIHQMMLTPSDPFPNGYLLSR